MAQWVQALLPLLGLLMLLGGVALMVIFAPDDARQALATEYANFLKVLAATAGPTAAAILGDLAVGERPRFDANSPPGMKRNFYISRYAGLLCFGIMGGAGAQYFGAPPMLGYAAAAAGGMLGTKIINVVFSRILDKYAPPVSPTGGSS